MAVAHVIEAALQAHPGSIGHQNKALPLRLVGQGFSCEANRYTCLVSPVTGTGVSTYPHLGLNGSPELVVDTSRQPRGHVLSLRCTAVDTDRVPGFPVICLCASHWGDVSTAQAREADCA